MSLAGALLLSKMNLIAFNGNNRANKVPISITGAVWLPPPFLSEWTAALHAFLTVVIAWKVTYYNVFVIMKSTM